MHADKQAHVGSARHSSSSVSALKCPVSVDFSLLVAGRSLFPLPPASSSLLPLILLLFVSGYCDAEVPKLHIILLFCSVPKQTLSPLRKQ